MGSVPRDSPCTRGRGSPQNGARRRVPNVSLSFEWCRSTLILRRGDVRRHDSRRGRFAVIRRGCVAQLRRLQRYERGRRYRQPMDEPITPKDLAAVLGVSDRTVRQWLRDQGWQSVPYARWELTKEQAAQVRDHFRPLGTAKTTTPHQRTVG